MATDLKLPELGENIEGGDVVRVLVKVGDSIKMDQPVLEMETGKASLEIPSTQNGIVKEILVKEGTKIKVGQKILTLDASSAAPTASKPTPKAEPKKEEPAPSQPQQTAEPQATTPPPRPVSIPAKPVAPLPSSGSGGTPVVAAPSTRQFAREIGIDIYQVQGGGPGGRISVDDVKAHARSLRQGKTPITQPELPDFRKWGEVNYEPLNNVRLATAEHMSVSWNQIPHVTLHDKADLTELEKVRKHYKAKVEEAGAKLTLTSFLIKIVAGALKNHPRFNASIDLAKSEMILKKYHHVGVAMDTDRGLIVPVIRDADQKNVMQIAKELGTLTEKAKNKKVTIEDMQGGCFTISNLGGLRTGFFTPIVNFPEVGILGVGRAVMEPVFMNGIFQPRFMLPLSLSFDHRVNDGANGARFLQWIIEAIEQPALLQLEG